MQSHLRKLTALGITALVVAGLCSAAHAQTEGDAANTERARELFLEGLELSDQGAWSEAARRFEAALALRDAPTIRYNLGTSLLNLERIVEAANHLDTARSHPEATSELVAQAEEQLATVEPRLSRIEIIVEGLEHDARVTLDGEFLSAEQLVRTQWVEPGHHVAIADQDGIEAARGEVDLVAGDGGTITLRALPHEAVVPPDDGLDGEDLQDDESTPLVRDWRLWVGVGAGVVALSLAFGLGFGLGLDGEPEDPIVGTMNPGVIEWP